MGKLSGSIAGAGAFHDALLKLIEEFIIAPFRDGDCGGTAQNNGALTLRRMETKVIQSISHRRSNLLFVALGEFPCHLKRPIAAAELFQLLQQQDQAVGGFVEHAGA